MKKDGTSSDCMQVRSRSSKQAPQPTFQTSTQRLQLNTIEYNSTSGSSPTAIPLVYTGPSIETILESSPACTRTQDNIPTQSSPLRVHYTQFQSTPTKTPSPDFESRSTLMSSSTSTSQFYGKASLIPHESVTHPISPKPIPESVTISPSPSQSSSSQTIPQQSPSSSSSGVPPPPPTTTGTPLRNESKSRVLLHGDEVTSHKQLSVPMSTVPTPDIPKSLRLIFEDDLLLPRYAEPIPIQPALETKPLEESRAKILEMATLYLQRQQQQLALQLQQQQCSSGVSSPSSGSATPKASPFLTPAFQPEASANMSPNMTPAQKPVSPVGPFSKPINIFNSPSCVGSAGTIGAGGLSSAGGIGIGIGIGAGGSSVGGASSAISIGIGGTEDELKQVASSPFTQMPLETSAVGRPRRMSTVKFQSPFTPPFRRISNASQTFESGTPAGNIPSISALSSSSSVSFVSGSLGSNTPSTVGPPMSGGGGVPFIGSAGSYISSGLSTNLGASALNPIELDPGTSAVSTSPSREKKVFSLDENVSTQHSTQSQSQQSQQHPPSPQHQLLQVSSVKTPPLPPPLSPPTTIVPQPPQPFPPHQSQPQQALSPKSSLSPKSLTSIPLTITATTALPQSPPQMPIQSTGLGSPGHQSSSSSIPLAMETPMGKRGNALRSSTPSGSSALQKTRSAAMLATPGSKVSEFAKRNLSASLGTPVQKTIAAASVAATASPYHANIHARRSTDFLTKPLITPRKNFMSKPSEPIMRSTPQPVPEVDSGNASLSPMESPKKEPAAVAAVRNPPPSSSSTASSTTTTDGLGRNVGSLNPISGAFGGLNPNSSSAVSPSAAGSSASSSSFIGGNASISITFNSDGRGRLASSPVGDPFSPTNRRKSNGGKRKQAGIQPPPFKDRNDFEFNKYGCTNVGFSKGDEKSLASTSTALVPMSSAASSVAAEKKNPSVLDEYYWNSQFMEAIEAISGLTHNSHFEERVNAYDRLSRLAEDFNQTVRTYGRIIISEVHLPVSQKSIKPASELGGIAGGEKYVVHGILFKFAVDSKNMYGGDEHAAKVAGHDLKSLVHLYNCWEPGVHFPMMTLVDYRGFRIVGMPLLPVSKATIVHGSNDAGKTIHTSPEFNRILKSIGEKLNLKPHRVGKEGIEFYTPIDLEGHLGEDGNFYMLDFSRLFPPQSPSCAHQMSHLYQLLRPEFVRMYKKPLCSDAFSTFIFPEHPDEERRREAEEHDSEVDEATRYLTEELVQVFAQRLVQLPRDQRDTFPLIVLLHESGINVRFLGLLYRYVDDLHDDYWTTKLLIEMATRVIKVELQALFRRNKAPGDSKYKKIVVHYMNLVFGNSPASKEYWRTKITPRMKKKFPGFIYDTPSPASSASPSLSPSFPSASAATIVSTQPPSSSSSSSTPSAAVPAAVSPSSAQSLISSPPVMFPPQKSPPPLSMITTSTATSPASSTLTSPSSATMSAATALSPALRPPLPGSQLQSPQSAIMMAAAAAAASAAAGNPGGAGAGCGGDRCLYDTIAKAAHSVGLLDGRCLLFRSVAQIMGLYFAPAIWKEANDSPAIFEQPYPFTETDLQELRERVKEMNVASHSRGYYLKTKAVAVKSPEERNRLLSLAVQQFSRALEGNPDNKVTLRNLGDCYILLGDMDKAQDVYERSIMIDPDDPNTLYKYGIALDKIGHLDEAERYYIRSLEAFPLHSNCFCAYADFLCYQRKNFDEAETFYKKAVEIDPTNYAASNNYAVFLVTVRRRMDEAEKCFARVVEGNPKCEIYLSNYASFLMHIKLEIEKAQGYALKARKLNQRLKTNKNYSAW